jgi:hypothetical protein
VIREDNNAYGGAVNVAARISSVSAPGDVLVSETMRSLARTSAGSHVRRPRRAVAEGRRRAGASVGGVAGGVKGSERPNQSRLAGAYPAAETIVRAAASNVIVSVLTTRS